MSTYLAIGSVCWDVVEGDPHPRLGGSVLFASRVARAAGWDATVVTSGTAELEAALRAALPDVTVTVQRSATDTVMAFDRAAELGPQRVPSRAEPLDLAGLAAVADAEVVHLAPIMGEVTPEVAEAATVARFVGITPQGMLRDVDDAGRLLHLDRLDPWWVDRVDAVVLSEDEYRLVDHPDAFARVALAVTRGERGCFGRRGDQQVDLDGIGLAAVSPVRTIGAGDVFAAGFFVGLASGAPFPRALDRANRTAAAHVGGGS